MAIVHQGFLRCPGCREYVIEADPEQYPDGVDYDTPDAAESKTKCRMCRVHEDGSDEECEPDCGDCAENTTTRSADQEPTEQLRQPTDTRLIRSNSVRWLQTPRWAAYYEGAGASKSGRRRVGLLVPRPTRQSPNGVVQIAYAFDGRLMAFPVSAMPEGVGEWYTAHASELPREQWTAIRRFARDLPPATSS